MASKTGALPPSGFGPELRRVREAKGLTQKQLGEAAGVHPNTVAKIERGEVEPSWQMVLAISTALGEPCTAFAGAPAPDPAAPGPAEPAEEPPAPKKKPKGKK